MELCNGSLAMHLVYKALEKYTIPNSLPPELMPPVKRKEPISVPTLPGAVKVLPNLVMPVESTKVWVIVELQLFEPSVPPLPVSTWVVTADEKSKYDTLFHQTDVDKDGFVSGTLCDIKQSGKLNGEQFALAMWLINQKLQGLDPPAALTSEMIPPSFRSKPPIDGVISLHVRRYRWDTLESGVDACRVVCSLNDIAFLITRALEPNLPYDQVPTVHLLLLTPVGMQAKHQACLVWSFIHKEIKENNNAPYSNPELDMITKDIEELAREKHILETDIAQKEADIKIKNGEIKSLQSELDTLAATLKQLENQKGEAQKRLNDLKNQKTAVEKELNDIQELLEEEQAKVDNLRRQADEQEHTLKSQEDELNSKKQELEGLKQEEAGLAQQQKDSRNQLDNLTKNLQDTQLQISQAKAKITQLQEQHRQMNDAVVMYDSAISSGDTSSVGDASLNITPEFRDPEYSRIVMVNGGSPIEHSKALPNSKDPFSSLNGPADSGGDAFGSGNLFKNVMFANYEILVPCFNQTLSRTQIIRQQIHLVQMMDLVQPSRPNLLAVLSNFVCRALTYLPPLPLNSRHNPQKDGFSADPFSSFGVPATTAKNDPFDPFGDGSNNRSSVKSPINLPGKDPFGCDPFESLHPASGGPPPRPESPSPALPPKKSKQPPPRPAPPRPLQQPTMRAAPLPPTPSPDPTVGRDPFSTPGAHNDLFATDPFGEEPAAAPVVAHNDPFASSSGSGAGSFADFSNFESKLTPLCEFYIVPTRSPLLLLKPLGKFQYESLSLLTDSFDSAVTIATLNYFCSLLPLLQFSKASTEISSKTVGIATKPSTQSGINKMTRSQTGTTTQSRYAGMEFTEDPFRDYRYEDPFNISDPFEEEEEKNTKRIQASNDKVDPFGFGVDSGFVSEVRNRSPKMNDKGLVDPFAFGLSPKVTAPADFIPPEAQQLAWAAAESLKLEEERRKRYEQEQADLEYALALSQTEKQGMKRI
uniref:EH domain-containing protein n=1 Tax=Timema monikensis TaxID=170555 RepID=A0A7R9E8Y6_9NEOP|nr:unnamed protein product [Timema monikensis]